MGRRGDSRSKPAPDVRAVSRPGPAMARGLSICDNEPTRSIGRSAMAALITAPRLMSIGGGALAELPGLLARLGVSRPLIVTDPYIAKCGILDRATALLDDAKVPWSVFSDTVPDPTTEIIETGAAMLA